MKQLPEDLLSKLEFDRILEILRGFCVGIEARDLVLKIKPAKEIATIQHQLDLTEELRQAKLRSASLNLHNYDPIQTDLTLLKTIGYVLSIEAIQGIQKSIQAAKALRQFINKKNESFFPETSKELARIIDHTNHLKEIEKIFDQEGRIKQNASPTLQSIFKSITSKNKELESAFRRITNSYKQQGYLQDNVETLRNGRRVLSVHAEHKRKVRGIIHDASATGKTAFVEPEVVIDINNDLFELENDKIKEVHRLIAALCDQLRPYISEIASNHAIVIKFDLIRAKAQMAFQMEALKPKLVDHAHFGFKHAFHPLLKWVNDKQKKATVPFDLELKGKNRILVISGPNAGGKSVTMKAVGLIQLMVQSGMLVPVSENTTIGIFDSMLCDIGDQQSLEDDLSTYSSRLKNMKLFSNSTNERSLLLIDEFGSGTDPKIGGALAESLLRDFNYKKAFGVVTTHYSNIKYYAYRTQGIVNASMLFDSEALQPSYQLKIGKPGSSFAFEIAKKIGLNKKIMDYAKFKTGKNEKAIDDLLINLQGDKKRLESRIDELEAREIKLQQLIDNYERMYGELQFKKKKLKLEKKAISLQNTDQEKEALQKLIKELRAAQDLKKVESIAAQKKEQKKSLSAEITELKEEVFYKDVYDISEFKVGGYAKLRDGGSIGKIIGIKKDTIDIALGLMQMQMNVKELVPSIKPIEINKKRSINTDITFTHDFESKLDLRGYLISDALAFVQEFIETAMIQNVVQLKIVHGKGSGKLRQAIHVKLKEYKNIEKIYHPEEEFGGEGVTLINL